MKVWKTTVAGAVLVTMAVFTSVGCAATLPKDANSTCPVMVKEEVDPDLHVEYEGRTVYLCCTKCKRKFSADPEKYIARLASDDKATTGIKKKSQSPAKRK